LLLLAGLLFMIRDLVPVPRPMIMLPANAALLWGLGLPVIGTQRFFGLRPSWWLFHSVWIVGVGGIAWFMLVDAQFAFRVAHFSFMAAVVFILMVLLVLRHGESHFSTWFFGGLMIVQSIVVLTRGFLALASGVGVESQIDLLHRGVAQSLYLATGNFMVLLLTVGFITMATRRLQVILERRSTLDPLTQVLNRRGFGDIYLRERALMRRDPSVMTMLSIDLDYFKAINDRFGHATGDRVLVDVADVIGKALRLTDHLARFGGEEFIVLLPNTGLDRARSVAERIQNALRAPRADLAGSVGVLPTYTVSIGIACQADAEQDLDGILMRADKALYRAKKLGRDRIEVAEPVPPAALVPTGVLQFN
ncbi:MAG: GGDEF domain-containing protein, partial [Sphingomonadaceae bacterium]